jgi:hypothetical protein
MIIECVLLTVSLCHVVKDKPVMALLAADVTIKIMDVRQTERNYRWGEMHPCSTFHSNEQLCGFVEHDAFVAPLVPHSAAFYAFEWSGAVFSGWIGHKLRESRRRWMRDIWWVPQTISVGQNLYGYFYSRSHYPLAN